MTLTEIDTRLKAAQEHNTKTLERIKMYSERIKSKFGVDTTKELKDMLVILESELTSAQCNYNALHKNVEEMMVKVGIA